MGIFCFAFQHPFPVPLMTIHWCTVGELHPLYLKPGGMGGPTLNSTFNSRGEPWLASAVVISLGMGREYNQRPWDRRILSGASEKISFFYRSYQKKASFYAWMVWYEKKGEGGLWQHRGGKLSWMELEHKAEMAEVEQRARELHPQRCHLDLPGTLPLDI